MGPGFPVAGRIGAAIQQDRRVTLSRNPLRRPPQAILLDAMGTLLRLDPPAPRLREELIRVAGVDVGSGAAERGFRAEIGCYLREHVSARDARSLDALRDRCALALAGELDAELPLDVVREAMLAALRFSAFDDAAPSLDRLRQAGVRLVVVSNWDYSLPDVLERVGLLDLVDGVATSAAAGAPKPEPAPFLLGLELAGCDAEEAWMAGDSPEADVAGAQALGISGILLAREPATDQPDGPGAVIRSLAELPSLI